MSVKPKDLCSRILGKKTVKVKNSKGEYEEFEIQRVCIAEFVGTNVEKMQEFVGKDIQEIQQMLLDDVKKKTFKEAIAPILLKGITSPKVVEKIIENCDIETEVPIDVILIDMELSTNLYTEILQLSVQNDNASK
jgi:hypothetical protein